MSTSDQQDHGPLTRKQLREIRLTGSTPVITPEEAAAAAEAAPPAPPLPRESSPEPLSDDVTPASAQADAAPGDSAAGDSAAGDSATGGAAPLTRRQAREQERVKTASVPVVGDESTGRTEPTQSADEPDARDDVESVVSEVPVFAAPPVADTAGDDDDIDDEIVIEPVRATEAADSVGIVPLEIIDDPADRSGSDDTAAALGLAGENDTAASDSDDVLADADDDDDDDVVNDPRPTVNSSFGEGLMEGAAGSRAPFRPSFDELLSVGDSTGSQHTAPSALIFTPSPGEGSLSGPVASTGEILVTGSYELPRGLGSQGHAHGTTDGRDVDAVLIDGELPPASSPTPIAASAAVSTIKPAGEVIRPPAPEKGNRLLLILAIVAGGLALAVGVAVIVAFTTNVF